MALLARTSVFSLPESPTCDRFVNKVVQVRKTSFLLYFLFSSLLSSFSFMLDVLSRSSFFLPTFVLLKVTQYFEVLFSLSSVSFSLFTFDQQFIFVLSSLSFISLYFPSTKEFGLEDGRGWVSSTEANVIHFHLQNPFLSF